MTRTREPTTLRAWPPGAISWPSGPECRVFAYLVGGDPGELPSAIDITLRPFAESQNLRGAFGRAVIDFRCPKAGPAGESVVLKLLASRASRVGGLRA